MSVVTAEGLSLTFPGDVQALKDVNLSVEAGEFVSFIGPSGCGKTTFLRVVADLEKPTGGEVRVTGLSPEEARMQRAYGYVFQQPGLLPMVELDGFGTKYPWQLSGGMQQRASIARALAFDAELLLMDEPFGALDEIVRDRLNDQLLDLWRTTQKTVLFVTHSIPEAVYLSTKIVVMSPRPGRVAKVINNPLPPDRPLEVRESTEFLAVAAEVRNTLREGMD